MKIDWTLNFILIILQICCVFELFSDDDYLAIVEYDFRKSLKITRNNKKNIFGANLCSPSEICIKPRRGIKGFYVTDWKKNC